VQVTEGSRHKTGDVKLMARGQCTFKQSDVTKAVKAVVAAGRDVRRVEIDREGKIVLVMIEPDDAEPNRNPAKIVL
jgi:hypothetical protein